MIYLVLAITFTAVFARGATTLAQAPLEARCTVAQHYLQNVQRSADLRARVDRLQTYQYMNQRLDLFVARLEKNGQPSAAQLRQEVEILQESTDAFKRHYESYDEARDAVVKLNDCTQKVAQFQKLLLTARDKRAAVFKDVVQIQNTHSGLLQQLTELKAELESNG